MKAEVLSILSDVPEANFPEKIANIAEHLVTKINEELPVRGYQALTTEQMVRAG